MAGKFAVLMMAMVTLAGCGQKGPLYLPDKGGEVVTRPGGGPVQQPAPPSQSPPASQDAEQKKKNEQPNPR